MRKMMIEWMIPLTKALQEEQNKCRSREPSCVKRGYADHLHLLDAERLATLSLSQLMIHIFQVIYKCGGNDDEDSIFYEGINERSFINTLGKTFLSQILYEQEERRFRDSQKQFDALLKKLTKARREAALTEKLA